MWFIKAHRRVMAQLKVENEKLDRLKKMIDRMRNNPETSVGFDPVIKWYPGMTNEEIYEHLGKVNEWNSKHCG